MVETLGGSEFVISDADKKIILELDQLRHDLRVQRPDEKDKISFDELFGLITTPQKEFIDRLMKIDPRKYGFKGPYLGIKDTPQDLVAIPGRHYKDPDGTDQVAATQYLSRPVYEAYQKMSQAMEDEIGRRILVDSAFRSAAYQNLVVANNLKKENFDLAKVLKYVALPGYSEHGDPDRQAIDFGFEEVDFGSISEEEYERSPEFEWLMANAKKFGFVLSYPRDNADGVAYEPWHWHFERSLT